MKNFDLLSVEKERRKEKREKRKEKSKNMNICCTHACAKRHTNTLWHTTGNMHTQADLHHNRNSDLIRVADIRQHFKHRLL